MDNKINSGLNNIKISQNQMQPKSASNTNANNTEEMPQIHEHFDPNEYIGRSMVNYKQTEKLPQLSPEQKKQEQIKELAKFLNDENIAEDIVENCFDDEDIKNNLLKNPKILADFYDTYKEKYCHGDKRGKGLGTWETCYLIEQLASECNDNLKDYHLNNYKLINSKYATNETIINDVLKYLNDDNNQIPQQLINQYSKLQLNIVREILNNCVNSEISDTVSFLIKELSPDKLKATSDFLFENTEKAEELVNLLKNNVDFNPPLEKLLKNEPKNVLKTIATELEKLKKEYNSKYFLCRYSEDNKDITMTDDIGHLFRFSNDTGKLSSIAVNNTTTNPELGTRITGTSTTKKDTLFNAVGVEKDVPNFMEIVINKQTGEPISTETFKESPVEGEYEIWQTYPDKTRDLVGLAEYDANGGKHIEKTLTALDGSKTQYAYADDKDGNRFLHYKITDKDGNTTFQTEKTFKVLSENHFQTSKNNEHYDIEIKDNKVITTKLDSKKEKTSEVVEYKMVDFSDEDYKKIYENFKDSDESTIVEELKPYGNNIVDKKLLPLLKQLSGDEWFALNKNTSYIIQNNEIKLNAFAGTNCIVVSNGVNENNFLATVEHEIGHEKFEYLNLKEDKELHRIYNEERENFINSFPQKNITSISYFLDDNRFNMKGLNETSAETNQLINIPQTFDAIKDRTIILQQYFPKTIAYIANKYENY